MAAPTPRPTNVFISYSRTDSPTIDRLEAELIGYGFHTWVDRAHLEGGDKWAAQIEQAIQASDAVVVGLSPDAVASPWVTNELFYANQLKKPLIPILLRPVNSVPLLLAATQYIDLHTDESQGMQRLRLRLLRLGGLPPTISTASSVRSPAAVNAPVTQHIAPTAQLRTNDPEVRLVAPLPPAPAADLNDLFVQSIAARAHGDLDQAEALLRQLVERDPSFGDGVAAQQFSETQRQLLPWQLDRLRRRGREAESRGAWSEAIGAWQALLDRVANDTEALEAFRRDKQNRDAAWLYNNARMLAQQNDWPAFHQMWQLLLERAPDYGDPERIFPNRETPNRGTPMLVVSEGKEPGRAYEILKDRVSIGRRPERDVFLEDLAVSILHASIVRQPNGGYRLRDENSANGTMVNGQRVSDHMLDDGDKIQVGQTLLVFVYR